MYYLYHNRARVQDSALAECGFFVRRNLAAQQRKTPISERRLF